MLDRDGPISTPSCTCSSPSIGDPRATGTTMTTHYDRDILIDYLHGALEPATDAAVFAHLKGCVACRTLRDEEAAFGDALRAAARKSELEFPSLVKARVWDAVRHE